MRQAGAEIEGTEVRLLVMYFVSRNMEHWGLVSAIERKLAGLAFFFKLRDMADLTKDFWLRQAVKGHQKLHKHKDARRPYPF